MNQLMNTLLTTIRALLLGCLGAAAISTAAWAVLIPLTEVREMEVADVRLPAHEVDRLVLRRCEQCKPEELRVSAATRYRIHGQPAGDLPLAAFRNAVRKAGQQDGLMLLVTYTVDTGQVTDVVLHGLEAGAVAQAR